MAERAAVIFPPGVTDESPNTCGACSPAKGGALGKTAEGRESRLNDVLIDRYREGENAGYPTLVRGASKVDDHVYNALEEPTSLNTIRLIPELSAAGIKAIKLEGRQRSPCVEQIVRVWREALMPYAIERDNFTPRSEWMDSLSRSRKEPRLLWVRIAGLGNKLNWSVRLGRTVQNIWR